MTIQPLFLPSFTFTSPSGSAVSAVRPAMDTYTVAGPLAHPLPLAAGGSGLWGWFQKTFGGGNTSAPSSLPPSRGPSLSNGRPRFNVVSREAAGRKILIVQGLITPADQRKLSHMVDKKSGIELLIEPGFMPEGEEWKSFVATWQQLAARGSDFFRLAMQLPHHTTLEFQTFAGEKGAKGTVIHLGTAPLALNTELLGAFAPNRHLPGWYTKKTDTIRIELPRGIRRHLEEWYQHHVAYPDGELRDLYDKLLRGDEEPLGTTLVTKQRHQVQQKVDIWRWAMGASSEGDATASELFHALHTIELWNQAWDIPLEAIKRRMRKEPLDALMEHFLRGDFQQTDLDDWVSQRMAQPSKGLALSPAPRPLSLGGLDAPPIPSTRGRAVSARSPAASPPPTDAVPQGGRLLSASDFQPPPSDSGPEYGEIAFTPMSGPVGFESSDAERTAINPAHSITDPVLPVLSTSAMVEIVGSSEEPFDHSEVTATDVSTSMIDGAAEASQPVVVHPVRTQMDRRLPSGLLEELGVRSFDPSESGESTDPSTKR
ncbi:MAG: hypothetical protein HY540_04655 [Deltaproteobacteria bacterium]|nr:hypothetical protein [Deltaproteobacteria bacterium]